MGDEGLELPSDSTGELTHQQESLADSCAGPPVLPPQEQQTAEATFDELQEMVAGWHRLTPAERQAVLNRIRHVGNVASPTSAAKQ